MPSRHCCFTSSLVDHSVVTCPSKQHGGVIKVRGASAFAFFQPHTGFAKGPIGTHYEHLLCEELIGSFHLVNTRGQRLRCDKYLPNNFVIVPGSVSMQVGLATAFSTILLRATSHAWPIHTSKDMFAVR